MSLDPDSEITREELFEAIATLLLNLGDREFAQRYTKSFSRRLREGREIPSAMRARMADAVDELAAKNPLTLFSVSKRGQGKRASHSANIYLQVRKLAEAEQLPLTENSDPNAFSEFAERNGLTESVVRKHYKAGSKLIQQFDAEVDRFLR